MIFHANLNDPEEFDRLSEKDIPFAIGGADFGPCLHKWNRDYLCSKLSMHQAVVHVADDPNLDFIAKNFKYCTMNLSEFLEKCSNEQDEKFYYLRSIGNDKRGKEVANLKRHFPTIADDLKYPEFLNVCDDKNDAHSEGDCCRRHIFSSVLRISSKQLSVWTHYDVLDNVLLQIEGRKRVILFPPNDAPNLYLKGDKSEIVSWDQPDLEEKYPLLNHCHRYEFVLEPGDSLFIPSMWFHTTKALDFSIGMNFFWRNAQLATFYDKTDVYGNKDLMPATNAFGNFDKALKHLRQLPDKYRKFYLNMILSKLNKELLEK